MKRLFLMIIVIVLGGIGMLAQDNYDPTNPPNPDGPPQEKTYKLTCDVVPFGAGRVGMSPSGGRYAQGKEVNLTAYNNSGYKFVRWVYDDNILSVNTTMTYTMSAEDTRIVAVFEYSPDSPANPDMPDLPPGGGDEPDPETPPFNPSSPSNPGTNSFDPATGLVIIDDFVKGYLSSAISAAISGHSTDDVYQIIVQGDVSESDVTVVNRYKNCSYIDLSRCAMLTTVPSYAFNGNTSLQQIILPSSVTEIKASAFANASALKEITCYAKTPPTVGNNAFDGLPSSTIIYVPEESVELYKAAEGWNAFDIRVAKKINDVDFTLSAVTCNVEKYAPEDEMTVSWTVTNEGSTASASGWRELIYLAKDDKQSVLLHTSYYTGTLDVGANVARTATFTLPQILGIDGESNVMVTLVPSANAGETVDAQANNVGLSANTIEIGKRLYLKPSANKVVEGQGDIAVSLRRSGSWTEAETFNVTVEGDKRVSAPKSVAIKEGQSVGYFYIHILDNTQLDEDSIAVVSVGGNGYANISDTLVIEDNDLKSLSVSTDKKEYGEGEIIHLTIETDKRVSKDTPVSLAIEQSKRFKFTDKALIPKDEKAVTVDIQVVDDDIPASEETVEVTAMAAGYEIAKTLFILKDDDVPAIDMTVTPEIVNEGDGVNAAHATISRTGVTGNAITLRLSDDGAGDLIYPKTVTMDKDEVEKTIVIGVRDNAECEGERVVTLKAAVYISTCDCNPTGSQQSSVERKIRVTDNDGPTLTLKSNKTTILEGDEENVEFTLERNTDVTDALAVTISCDIDGVIIPKQVTIPPGKRSTTFTLEVKSNDVQEGNRIANITARCDGYNMGSAWIMITDQTLPDAIVSDISIDRAEIVSGSEYVMTITLKNIGAADIPAKSVIKLDVVGETIPLTVPEKIESGKQTEMSINLNAPAAVGTYSIFAQCNANNAFAELQTSNNIYERKLNVVSAYTYIVNTEKKVYNMGETVHVTGQIKARGNDNVGNVEVEPYVVAYGEKTALKAVTASDGTFSLDYFLPKTFGGRYSFGVCMPGEDSKETVADIDVYGMARPSASYIKNMVYINEPYKFKVAIKNLTSLPLHNIKAAVDDANGHYQLTCNTLDVLGGNATADVELTVVSDKLTTTDSWERMRIILSSDEGAELPVMVYNYTATRHALLKSGVFNINSTVTKGKSRLVPVVLTNSGLGETGKITVDIPQRQSFVALGNGDNIPSLATGDSTLIYLKFSPDNLDVNVIQKGQIAVNCENGDGLLIYYNIKVVSEEKGNLQVTVQDENTIYGNAAGEHPYVAGARVQVKDYNTGGILYESVTGSTGSVRFDNLDEGYYTVYITSDKHDSYRQNVLVSPGETTQHFATISYNAISVSWDVVESTFEDKYEITSELVYETQVPEPVLELNAPRELDLNKVLDGGTLLYNIIVINKGLITAENVCVSVPSAEGFRFMPLDEYSGFDLKAGQTKIIPVYVTLDNNAPKESASFRKAPSRAGTKYVCTNETYLNWEWPCGEDSNYGWISYVGKFLLRTCSPTNVPTPDRPGKDKPEKPIIEWTGPSGTPGIWHVHGPVSQVDLYSMYQWTCKISCALVCFAKDGKLSFDNLKCVWQSLDKEYGNTRKAGERSHIYSLYQTYEKKVNLINAIDSLYDVLADITLNSPELKKDTATYAQVIKAAGEIDGLLQTKYETGSIYDTPIETLCEEAMPMMPYGKGEWYDFSLGLYIERKVNTYRKRNGMSVTGDNYIDIAKLDAVTNSIDSCMNVVKEMGFVDQIDLLNSANEDVKELYKSQGSTCASVKLQIKQELVLTRQAFQGTLTIENGTSSPLTDISTIITATDEFGNVATSREMEIHLLSMEGFDADGDKWKLDGGMTGTAVYEFIPTKYAAEYNDVAYDFGGTLYFTDANGEQVRSLYPSRLTVRPAPVLDLTYFVQRDVYGDNPLTEDVVEPVISAEFTVLIHNKGNGDADNVRMVTHQPEIIENEKGLLVDFAIVSSSLNGGDASLALSDDISTDFGSIKAGLCSWATWGLASTLLGHFNEYDVSYSHLTSYGNPDLSLLDKVTVKELIHSINARIGDKTYRAWITNDEQDAMELPDRIYFSDGTNQRLHALPDGCEIERLDNSHSRITVDAVTNEWFYANAVVPNEKTIKILGITNEDTGEKLDKDNFWTTEYTMKDHANPIQEYRIHIADLAAKAGKIHYVLEYEPQPDVVLAVDGISPAVSSSDILVAPINKVTVTFNKDIDASTFTSDDITVRYEGKIISVPFEIERVDARTYSINTSELKDNGYYCLTVNTINITDSEGFSGKNGESLNWLLYNDGKINLNITVEPEEAGEAVALGDAVYGSAIKLVATANSGYDFIGWSVNGDLVSTEPVYECAADYNLNIVAKFVRNDLLGVESVVEDAPYVTIYTTTGVLVARNAERQRIKTLRPNVYIINGRKCIIKKE